MKNLEHRFIAGDKVIWNTDKRLYDFGYSCSEHQGVIYRQGERHTHDIYAINLSELRKVWVD